MIPSAPPSPPRAEPSAPLPTIVPHPLHSPWHTWQAVSDRVEVTQQDRLGFLLGLTWSGEGGRRCLCLPADVPCPPSSTSVVDERTSPSFPHPCPSFHPTSPPPSNSGVGSRSGLPWRGMGKRWVNARRVGGKTHAPLSHTKGNRTRVRGRGMKGGWVVVIQLSGGWVLGGRM